MADAGKAARAVTKAVKRTVTQAAEAALAKVAELGAHRVWDRFGTVLS